MRQCHATIEEVLHVVFFVGLLQDYMTGLTKFISVQLVSAVQLSTVE
jgi:hypothetical protein